MLETLLQSSLDQLISSKKFHQGVMAVEKRDGSFSWKGVAKQEALSSAIISTDSPFFIASIDKLLNATIILMLQEQGKLAIDDLVANYLPPDFLTGIHVYQGVDYSQSLTIRHLLTHSSGLADWLEDFSPNGTSLVQEILTQGDRFFTFNEISERIRSQLKPHFPPQNLTQPKVKIRYSDTNFILLIAIIEKLCGKPLHLVHHELLYSPLGMKNTFFPGFSDFPVFSSQARQSDKTLRPEQILQPVPLRSDGQLITIPELMKSFRGIYSTTEDLFTFFRALVNENLFQQEETLAMMSGSWNTFGFPSDKAAIRSPGWPIEYGMGIMRFQLPRIFTSLQKLPLVIGHTGSTGCWLFWAPELDMFLAGSVDEASAGAVPYRFVPEILKILKQDALG